jgi:hypothetical protein
MSQQVLSVILKNEGISGIELTEMLTYFESKGLIGILIGYSVFEMFKVRNEIQEYRNRRSREAKRGGGGSRRGNIPPNRNPSFGDPVFDEGVENKRPNPRGGGGGLRNSEGNVIEPNDTSDPLKDGLRRRRPPPVFNDPPIDDPDPDDENNPLITVPLNRSELKSITGHSPIRWSLISGILVSLGFSFVPIAYADRIGEYKANLPIDDLAVLRTYLHELEEERNVLRGTLLELNIFDECFAKTKKLTPKKVYKNINDYDLMWDINMLFF